MTINQMQAAYFSRWIRKKYQEVFQWVLRGIFFEDGALHRGTPRTPCAILSQWILILKR